MSVSYETLDAIADSFNPLIAVVAAILAVRPFAAKHWSMGLARVRVLGELLAVVYALRFLDRVLDPANGASVGYSTHTAFAVAVTAFICTYQTRAKQVWWVAFLMAYLALVRYQGYHSLGDIALSALLVSAAAWVVLWRDPNRVGRTIDL